MKIPNITGDVLPWLFALPFWLLTGVISFFVDGEEYVRYDDSIGNRALEAVPLIMHMAWYIGFFVVVIMAAAVVYNNRDELADWANDKLGLTEEEL